MNSAWNIIKKQGRSIQQNVFEFLMWTIKYV